MSPSLIWGSKRETMNEEYFFKHICRLLTDLAVKSRDQQTYRAATDLEKEVLSHYGSTPTNDRSDVWRGDPLGMPVVHSEDVLWTGDESD